VTDTNVDALVARALEGDRAALARVVSLVEQGGEPARVASARYHRRAGHAWVVGITGAPGAGKSTLTDRLVAMLLEAPRGASRRRAGVEHGGHREHGDGARVAVLAIDPTSPFTGGAILGDRVRMQEHATDPRVFIRSMATRGHLGGLSASAPQAARLLDAAGYDWVIVETVGVGQVEVEVAGHADTTVVVVNPGWGDAVQANKAGLMEIADVFVVNKADRAGARDAVRELDGMLELSTARDWRPPIVSTVATDGEGVAELVDALEAHRAHLDAVGEVAARRRARAAEELTAVTVELVAHEALARCAGPEFDALVDAVADGTTDPYEAAARLLGPR
jgi:LAO/AO transport system kinase